MLIHLIHAFLTYLFFWLTGYVAGIYLPRMIRHDHPSFILPLTGFILQIPLLSFLSLLLPLSSRLFLLIIAVLMALTLAKPVRTAFTVKGFTISVYSLSAMVAVFLLVYFSAFPPLLSDMWGYHVQAIQWVEKYPAVPGLGNLCPKFAFNFGTFLPMALLSCRSVLGQPVFTLNIFLAFLATLQLLHLLRTKVSLPEGIILLSGFLALLHYTKSLMPTTSAECSSAILLFILFLLWMEKAKSENPHENKACSVLIIALTALLPVIKLTNTPILLLLPVMLRKESLKPVVMAASICLVIWLPWMARNVILTGYIFYPFPFIDVIHVDWKIPYDVAFSDFQWVRSWARIPFQPPQQVLNMPMSEWVKYWAMHIGWVNWLLLMTGVVATILLGLSRKIRRNSSEGLLEFWFVIIIILFAWFLFAPDPRFVITPLLLFPLIPLLSLSKIIRLKPKYANHVHFYSTLVIVYAIVEWGISKPMPAQQLMGPQAFPEVKMKAQLTDGLWIYTPVTGVNCYDFPVPCAPSVTKGLSLRGNSLSDGFYIQQTNYNN